MLIDFCWFLTTGISWQFLSVRYNLKSYQSYLHLPGIDVDPFDEWAVAAVERKKKKEKHEHAETCETCTKDICLVYQIVEVCEEKCFIFQGIFYSIQLGRYINKVFDVRDSREGHFQL